MAPEKTFQAMGNVEIGGPLLVKCGIEVKPIGPHVSFFSVPVVSQGSDSVV